MENENPTKGLPADLKEAVSSIGLTEKIVGIGKKHSLHIDQTGELGSEIRYVMMGKSARADFVKNLCTRLEIDGITAEAIAQDVNEQIFLPIRASLQEIQEKREHQSLDQVPGMETVRPQMPADTEDHSALRKDDILADIENPVVRTPTVAPAAPTAVTPVVAPAPLPENAGLLDFDKHGLLEKIENPLKKDVSEEKVSLSTDTDIVSMKLSGPVSAPVETEIRKPATGYAVDPYREAI